MSKNTHAILVAPLAQRFVNIRLDSVQKLVQHRCLLQFITVTLPLTVYFLIWGAQKDSIEDILKQITPAFNGIIINKMPYNLTPAPLLRRTIFVCTSACSIPLAQNWISWVSSVSMLLRSAYTGFYFLLYWSVSFQVLS